MSGRRAAYKVARKNAIRNRKRTIFLVLLVAVPVALGVVVAGIVRASSLTPEEQVQSEFGAADARLYVSGPSVTEWVYSTVAELSPDTTITEFRQTGIRVPGAGYAQVSDINLSEPATAGLLVLVDGSSPRTEGEVAISPTLAEELEVTIGDVVEFDGLPLGELEIVGLVGQPFSNQSSDILVSPEGLSALAENLENGIGSGVLLGGPDAENAALQINDLWYSEGQPLFWPEPAVDPKPVELEFLEDQMYVLLSEKQINELVGLVTEAEETGGDPFSAVYDRANQMVYGSGVHRGLPELYAETRTQRLNQGGVEDNPGLVATGATALLLVEVAFVTGAAFAAGTRRRLREIGLMGANGASEKHVRATVVGEGLSIASVGAVVGVVLGIGVLVLARPLLHRFVSRLIVGVGVTFSDVIGPVAVALVSVLLAVLIPARTASKVPTTTALQGRMPALSPRKWVVPVGIGASAVGLLLISVSLASNSNYAGFLVGVGAVLVVGGVAMLSSPILAGVSKLSDHVPAASRLVLRDSGRNRTRSAVAVAAIMVILLAPIISMTVAATSAEKDLIFGLPDPGDQLVLRGNYGSGVGGSAPITEADVAAMAALVPEKAIAVFDTLDVRVMTDELLTAAESGNEEPVSQNFSDGYAVAVGSDELVAALDNPGVTSSIEGDEIVVLGLEDKKTRVGLNGTEYPAHEYPVSVARWSMPRVLVPEMMVVEFSDIETKPMALFVLERPMTDDEREQMYEALTLDISGGWNPISESTLSLIAGGLTLIFVLIVVALVTAVSAAEVDQEIRTIVAVGAPGAIRRRFLGLLTGYQTLVAMLLALPLGLGLVWVFNSAQDFIYAGPFGLVNQSAVTVPWAWIIPFAVLLPIVIGLLTLISVRSAPVTPPRRAT